jgi:hypothetical protein
MLFYEGVLIDLITFAALTILYFAYDLYVVRIAPTHRRHRATPRKQRTPAVVLRFPAAMTAQARRARRA